MHEFGIVENLVKTVIKELESLATSRTLRNVRLVMGAGRRLSAESVRFAYEIQTRDTCAAGSSLDITIVPVTALCKDCGWRGELHDFPYLCRECGSINLNMFQGMEFYLAGLEVDDNEATAN